MGEAPTDHCDHGPMALHLINSKHTKRPLPILVLLSESAQFGQNGSQILTTEFGQKRSFCTLLTKVFLSKIVGQKYTFCTLLTTTVLTFWSEMQWPKMQWAEK